MNAFIFFFLYNKCIIELSICIKKYIIPLFIYLIMIFNFYKKKLRKKCKSKS